MSGCPFLSNLSQKKPENVPIEEILTNIIRDELGLVDINIDTYTKIFKDNLIYTSDHLFRLKPSLIEKLRLPLLVESELTKLVELHTSENPSPRIHSTTGSNSGSKGSPSTSSEGDTNITPTQAYLLNRKISPSRQEIVVKQKSALLGLDSDTRKTILNSWNQLITSKDGSLSRFFDEFYKTFLARDRVGKVLFGDRSMVSQAQALMKMMKFIMGSINEPLSLMEPLQRLGISHLIYGVEKKNYHSFAISLAKTFETVLGDSVTPEMKEGWYTLAMRLGDVMLAEYEGCRNGWKQFLYYRKSKNTAWKLRATLLTHEKLIIYRSTDYTKVLEEIFLHAVEDLDIIEEGNIGDGTRPNAYAFTMNTGVYNYVLCSPDEESYDKWIDELTIRIRAHYRVGIQAVDSDEEKPTDGKKDKRGKKVKKMKKKLKEKGL